MNKITDMSIPTYLTTPGGMLTAEAEKYLMHLHELLHDILKTVNLLSEAKKK